jgi:hypothetical protein
MVKKAITHLKLDQANELSDRWQRCAWQQACGIVRSWCSCKPAEAAECLHPGQRQCGRHRTFQNITIRLLTENGNKALIMGANPRDIPVLTRSRKNKLCQMNSSLQDTRSPF